jgi:hypothetical protein
MRLFVATILTVLCSVIFLALPSLASAQVSQQDINNGLCSGSNLDFTGDSAGSCSSGDATQSINNIVHSIINILSLVVGVVAVIMIIIGGLRYITSGGNDTGVTGAKNTILYAVIGLIIVALAQIIVHFVLAKVTSSD